MESEMIKKILFLLVIFMLLVASASPAAAQKPPESDGNPTNQNNGNTAHENQGNHTNGNNGNGGNSNNSGGNRNAANPDTQHGNRGANANGNSNTANGNADHGFDDSGYNHVARIFNGTAMQWCMEKVGDETWCEDYLGESANDKLIMKWNAEWDRGNAEGWANPPYDAWENNQWNGNVPGGSGDVWHYKIVWIEPCEEGTDLPNGGYCIWGQFAVLMDHGTADGVHEWLAHAIPNGYGSYP
jgi:hypothetical protein